MKKSAPAALLASALVLAAACAALVLVAPARAQQGRERKAEAAIVQGDALCTQQNPAGGSSITRLVEGGNAFVGRLALAPSGKVPEHKHASEEYVVVLHGSGTFTVEGRATKVGPGAAIYIPSNAVHSYENGPEALEAIQVYADPSAARKYDAWPGCKAK